MKYFFCIVQLFFTLMVFSQQKSSNIRLPLSHINQQNISTKTATQITDTPILVLKAKDSIIIDSINTKRITDSLILLDYNEKSKSIDQANTSINIPAQINNNNKQNTGEGYVVKPMPNPFDKDTSANNNNHQTFQDTFNNNTIPAPPINTSTETTSPTTPLNTKNEIQSSTPSTDKITVEDITTNKPSRKDEIENIRKYYKNRRYATAYVGLGYNMSLVDVCGGIRLYQFNNLPLYFEIDLFFNSFIFKKFAEPVFAYRVMPSINVGYTYEFSDFLNGVGLSASAGVGPYHEGYNLLTDVGFLPIVNDRRFVKFAWDWAIDATFSLDKAQRFRLMLKHKMMYLTKSNFGNTIQSISVNALFRLDYKKVEERRKIENIYLNY